MKFSMQIIGVSQDEDQNWKVCLDGIPDGATINTCDREKARWFGARLGNWVTLFCGEAVRFAHRSAKRIEV